MSAVVIDRLREERDQARDAAIALAEADNFDPDSESFRELENRSASLDGQIARLSTLLEARQAADALDGRLSRAQERQQREQSTTREVVGRAPSLGDLFIRSEQFTNYRMKGNSGVLTVEDGDLQTRALPTGMSDLLAAGLQGVKTTVDTTAPDAPTPVLDACTQITVSGNAIEYIAWTKKAGGAAVVAEKAAKPPVEFGPVVTPATLDMIAGYTQLTRQMIEDFGAVRGFIDTELRREVARKEEELAAAALAAATLPTAAGGGELLAAIRVGVGTVQAAGYSPNAVMLNPADYADLDVSVMGATLNGPVVRQNFWGLSVLPSTTQPAGTATVGDFRAGVHHYARSGINLFITDSHADTFLTNVFTLLAERRSKTVIVRPAALVECTAS